jgi:WD40 repeat protein
MTGHPRSDLNLIGTVSGNLIVFDPTRAQVVQKIKAHTKDITQIVFAPKRESFLTTSIDGFVQWWSAVHFQREQGYSAGCEIFAVAGSPKGRYVAAGGADKTIRIWDTQTSELAHVLTGHTDAVSSLAWLSESILLSGGATGIVRAWEVEFRRCFRAARVHEDHVARIVVSNETDSYLTAAWDGRVKIWTNKHRPRFELPAGPAAVTSVALLPDQKHLCVGYWNGTAAIWNLDMGTVFEEFSAHEGNLAACAVALNGQLVVTANEHGQLRSWSLASMGVSRFANLHTGEVYGLSYLPDNTQALSVGHDGQIKLWDRDRHCEVAALDPQAGPFMSCAISPDKHTWAFGLSSGEIRLWNADQQLFEGSLVAHKDAISSLAFLPNGHQLVSASWDMKLKIWSLERQQVLCTMHGHSKEIASMAISLDGRYAASACWDMTARLWDLSAKRRDYLAEMRCLVGHRGRVLACDFSPDASLVATASSDETVRLWQVDIAVDPQILHTHHDAVTDCKFTPDGKLLVSVGRDGLVVIWQVDSASAVAQLKHESPILSLAIAPDGSQAMIGDEVGRVRFLKLSYTREFNWVAAASLIREVPFWMRGARPVVQLEVTCLYCGHSDSIKRQRLGKSWRCPSCGESMHICPSAMAPRTPELVD